MVDVERHFCHDDLAPPERDMSAKDLDFQNRCYWLFAEARLLAEEIRREIDGR